MPVGQAGTAAAGITGQMILGGGICSNFRVAGWIVRVAGCGKVGATLADP